MTTDKSLWVSGVVLLALVVPLAVGFWLTDPGRSASAPAAAPVPASAAAAQMAPGEGATLKAGSLLVTSPGAEANAAQNPSAVLCRPGPGAPVTIKRATRLLDGALYFDVWVRDQCYGWVPAEAVDHVPAWRSDIAPGELINH